MDNGLTSGSHRDATALWRTVEQAVSIAGLPQWFSPDPDGCEETLVFVPDDDGTWVLAPTDLLEEPLINDRFGPAALAGLGGEEPQEQEGGCGHDNEQCDCDDDQELVAVGPDMAAELLRGFFRDWLAERGWQVQLSVHKGASTWKLVDCLSFAEGGGDRLDEDYPQGDNELDVLCESVVAITPGRGE